jgi:putative redox protein
MRKKVEFASNSITLSGALEAPESDIRCFALFAHCFTCGKDIAAASRIARALTSAGIAVLRFDFTGLGNSDGDFANTNFSSNVQDLLAAVDFLRDNYDAPQLLIGHSLGGAAVLAMANDVPECRAVVTIGAPFDAAHVKTHFQASIADIERAGEAPVNFAGRTFLIRKQFLDDLDAQSTEQLGQLRKALLVMHAPLDTTVSIREAEKIYSAAKHPKSFISLDDADHLLSRKEDAEYVAQTIAAWVGRYLLAPLPTQTARPAAGHVRVEEKDHQFTQHVNSDSHYWLADEPLAMGGSNRGPDPYEHLLAALGACTAMTLRMYASRKQIPLEHVAVELRHRRDHIKDCAECPDGETKIEAIEREITLLGKLTTAQRERLLQIADRCPVHRTLHGELDIITRSL